MAQQEVTLSRGDWAEIRTRASDEARHMRGDDAWRNTSLRGDYETLHAAITAAMAVSMAEPLVVPLAAQSIWLIEEDFPNLLPAELAG